MTQSKVLQSILQYAISDFNVMGACGISYELILITGEDRFEFTSSEVRLEVVGDFIKASAIIPYGVRYEYIKFKGLKSISLRSNEYNDESEDIDNVRKRHDGMLLIYNIEEIK